MANFPDFSGRNVMMASAQMAGFPWEDLRKGIGNYYDDAPSKPKLLAMFETIDGCIKFEEFQTAPPSVEFATHRLIALSPTQAADPLDQLQAKVTKRKYILNDRSGPGGMILHYKEVVE